MKINLKARLKNKAFVVSMAALIVSFVYKALTIFEIVPPVGENEVLEIIGVLINLLAFVGVLTDPTTEGLCDSERALTYFTENDARVKEVVSCE